jgi:hypothetical protein
MCQSGQPTVCYGFWRSDYRAWGRRSTDVSAHLVLRAALNWFGMTFDDSGLVLSDKNSIAGRSGLYVRYHVQACVQMFWDLCCLWTAWRSEIDLSGIHTEPSCCKYQSSEELARSKFSYVKHFVFSVFVVRGAPTGLASTAVWVGTWTVCSVFNYVSALEGV